MTARTTTHGSNAFQRIMANYGSPAAQAIVVGSAAFAILLLADRDWLTAWLLDRDLAPVASAGTAADLVNALIGVNAAFITLYFSISLIVLTIAASNLGVRLIDRWLKRRTIRAAIGIVALSQGWAILTAAAVDGEKPLAEIPLGCVAVSIALTLAATALLAIALHDLGRTMFVDRAIANLAADGTSNTAEVTGGAPYAGGFAKAIPAPRAGYVEVVDTARIVRTLGGASGAAGLCAAPGQHVFAGEPLLLIERPHDAADSLADAFVLRPFRSDGQGAVFEVRLLVEIAARAMSPAVNDFYTALVAADAIAEVIAAHRCTWVAAEQAPVLAEAPWLEVPGQDFRGLFDDPMAAFRQAAAKYPSVSLRMIGNLARVAATCGDDGLAAHLAAYARRLSEHAAAQAGHEFDREALADAIARFDDG